MIFIYSESMTNDLIKRAQNNDQEALSELIRENERMVHLIISKYSTELGDYAVSKDDLFQEGLIGIHEAIKHYDETKNVKFSTFAYKVIKSRIFKYYIKQARIYKEEHYSYSKLDEVDHYYSMKTDYVSDNPIAYLQNDYYKGILEAVISELDDLDKKIIKMKLNNYTYEEIAKALSVTNKMVDYRFRRIRTKYKEDKERFFV